MIEQARRLVSARFKPAAERTTVASTDEFPFSLPAIRTLPTLEFSADATFFVGENGSGKSTLLEAIAIAAELPALGSSEVALDTTLHAQRQLAADLRLSWRQKSRRGFYLRAEDFFGYLKRQAREDARYWRERDELTTRGVPQEEAERRAISGDHVDERDAAKYVSQYDSRSHGESFIDLFASRMQAGGLYLLDEPEAPLSPQRQLAFLSLMQDAAQRGAQFIIATHSPILLAYPGARIYSFDSTPITLVAYDELEQVRLVRDFLNEPERYLRHFKLD